ncbi:hypothetical protein BDK51DRAFT_34056, partial [Blyttiomyces helicus]
MGSSSSQHDYADSSNKAQDPSVAESTSGIGGWLAARFHGRHTETVQTAENTQTVPVPTPGPDASQMAVNTSGPPTSIACEELCMPSYFSWHQTSNIQPPRAPTSIPATTDFASPYKLEFTTTTSAVTHDVASPTVLLSAPEMVAAPSPAEPDVDEETPPLVLTRNGIRAQFWADSEECGRYRFLKTLGQGTF